MYYEIIDSKEEPGKYFTLSVKPRGITHDSIHCQYCHHPWSREVMDEIKYVHEENRKLIAERTELSAERDKVKETLRILRKHVEHLENLLEKHERRVCQNG